MNLLVKLTAVLVSAVGTAGILIHDVHVDRMTLVAFSAAGALATYASVENILQKSDHIHVEGGNVGKSQVGVNKNRIRDDHRKYIQNRKVLVSGGDEQNSLWPSI